MYVKREGQNDLGVQASMYLGDELVLKALVGIA
jgi:hypothetical protein